MTFANIPPTLSLVLTSDLVIYLILRAQGAESVEMDTGVLTAPGAMDDPAYRHRMGMIMASAGEIIAQDLHVDELVQAGLRSRHAPARPLFLAGGGAAGVQRLADAALPGLLGAAARGRRPPVHFGGGLSPAARRPVFPETRMPLICEAVEDRADLRPARCTTCAPPPRPCTGAISTRRWRRC